MKWDWVSSKIQLTSGSLTVTTGEHYCQYKDMTLNSGLSAAPEIAEALLLYPDELAETMAEIIIISIRRVSVCRFVAATGATRPGGCVLRELERLSCGFQLGHRVPLRFCEL